MRTWDAWLLVKRPFLVLSTQDTGLATIPPSPAQLLPPGKLDPILAGTSAQAWPVGEGRSEPHIGYELKAFTSAP